MLLQPGVVFRLFSELNVNQHRVNTVNGRAQRHCPLARHWLAEIFSDRLLCCMLLTLLLTFLSQNAGKSEYMVSILYQSSLLHAISTLPSLCGVRTQRKCVCQQDMAAAQPNQLHLSTLSLIYTKDTLCADTHMHKGFMYPTKELRLALRGWSHYIMGLAAILKMLKLRTVQNTHVSLPTLLL